MSEAARRPVVGLKRGDLVIGEAKRRNFRAAHGVLVRKREVMALALLAVRRIIQFQTSLGPQNGHL